MYLLYVIFLIPWVTSAQEIVPPEGSSLNYREVIFEFPETTGAANYHLYIRECSGKDCVPVFDTLTNMTALRLNHILKFGKQYRWFYSCSKNGEEIFRSGDHYFNILSSPLVDTLKQKLVIFKNHRGKTGGGIIFLDGLKIAVTHDGSPVWFMNNMVPELTVRDLEITPAGTITYLTTHEAKETSLNGEELWNAPSIEGTSKEKKEVYHHEFTRLKNGNYIIVGKMLVKRTEEEPGITHLEYDADKDYLSDVIVEFNHDGEMVWLFKALPELKRSFGISPSQKARNRRLLGHLNGLAVDEEDSVVYASFKNFNAVLKIDKRTNHIAYVFGNKHIVFADSTQRSPFFSQQHCPVILKNGNLMIYDNNGPKTGSGLVELNISPRSKEAEKVWEFRIKNAGFPKYYAPNMGSVQELENGNLLSSMGNQNTVFEVTRKRDVVWQVATFTNSMYPHDTSWEETTNYRVKWSSSLFPNYYTLQRGKGKDTIRTDEGLSFKINNIGTEPATYTIEVLQPSSGMILKKGNLKIDGETSKEISVKPEELLSLQKNREMIISVVSSFSSTPRELHYILK